MQPNRSPPKHGQSKMGGSSATTSPAASLTSASVSPASVGAASAAGGSPAKARAAKLTPMQLTSHSAACRAGSTASLYSNSSTNALLASTSASASERHYHAHCYPHHGHSHHHHHGGGGGGGVRHSAASSSSSSSSMSASSMASFKRGKKQSTGSKRAGMSFLIVIAFFAVFGLIILTELFMIDERSHTSMMSLRHGGNYGGRLGDSMPDYDNAKDDYDLMADNLLSDNKLGFIQFQDNKLKIQDADNNNNDGGRLAGILLNSAANGQGGMGAAGSALAAIPWGKVLSPKVEETLPHFALNPPPTDGSWQVVNGTRFKFFVYSAYYDRRDGSRLVRIIGATKTRGPERVFCRFWYAGRNTTTADGARGHYTSATVMARVKVIRENWNLKYSACFVLCPIRGSDPEVPYYVSVVLRLRAPPGNLLQLRNTNWDPDFATNRTSNGAASGAATASAAASLNSSSNALLSHAAAGTAAHEAQPQQRATATSSSSSSSSSSATGTLPRGEQIADKIAICVKPFHFNYDKALYLMEYLEFYALLGVAHFTFYNHTIGPHATCVLQHYVDGDVPANLTAWDEELLTAADVAAAPGTAQQQQQKQQQRQSSRAKVEDVPSVKSAGNNNGSTSSNNNNTGNAAPTTTTSPPSTAPPPAVIRQRYESLNYVKPTINILPWNLRMRSQKEIRTEGLFAALNDCLYRTMYRYKYLALVDLDEFIVPRHKDTLTELINSLNSRFRNRNTGAYSFQNAFFYLQFPDDPLVMQNMQKTANPQIHASLVTQRKTWRRFKLHPQKQRSKYICKPEAVVEAGNHFVWEYAPGKGSLNVPPTEAILQHYRVCEFGGNDCIKAPSVIDRTATKYVNRLVSRVEAVYNYLKKPCSLPDLPMPAKQTQIQPEVSNDRNKNNENKKNTESSKKNNEETKQPKQQQQQEQQENNENIPKAMTLKTKPKSTAKTTLTANNTNPSEPAAIKQEREQEELDERQAAERRKKQRKVVIFEPDDYGNTNVRLEYVDK